jgi:hypothetical protein
MNNINNMNGMPMGGQQRKPFPMQLQNQQQLGAANQTPVSVDYSWQSNHPPEFREGAVKSM